MQVYKLTNVINGMEYVGATMRPIKRRLGDHCSAAKQGRTSLIAGAIREFGIDSFKVTLLETGDSFDDLMLKEIAAIKEHGTLSPHGYNRASGGKGTPDCRHLESTRLKISEAAKGRKCPDHVRKVLSEFFKGRPAPNKGMITGKPAWNRGLTHTDETRAKMSAAHRGKQHPKARAIEFNGVTYKSIADAVRDTGMSLMQVRYRLSAGRARYCNLPDAVGKSEEIT